MTVVVSFTYSLSRNRHITQISLILMITKNWTMPNSLAIARQENTTIDVEYNAFVMKSTLLYGCPVLL